jgi:hypothetical protein
VPEIFGALTDFGPGSRWYTGVADEQHEPPGLVGAGTQITQFRDERGRRDVTRYLISGWDPPRSLTLQSVGASPASTIRYTLEDGTAGVTLSCAIAVETGGLLRLVESRLRRNLEAKLGETLDAFRRAMTP